jgi:hypothetical protein
MFKPLQQEDLVCPMQVLPCWFGMIVAYLLLNGVCEAALSEREIPLAQVTAKPVSFKGEVTETSEFIWWLPSGADALVLPVADGIVVDTTNPESMKWLRKGSPWGLMQLPAFGVFPSPLFMVTVLESVPFHS